MLDCVPGQEFTLVHTWEADPTKAKTFRYMDTCFCFKFPSFDVDVLHFLEGALRKYITKEFRK
jgi:hypothetical protein